MTKRRGVALLLAALIEAGCGGGKKVPDDPETQARDRMVNTQIAARGVRDPRILAAMKEIPRETFVDARYRSEAYADHPLPIGDGQTVTQPYVAALMTELLDIQPSDRVLEIGTGSGYESAILSRLASRVYSIEILPEIARKAQEKLRALHCENIDFRVGDGYRGWPEAAPFDAIIVTAAPRKIPEPLLAQLAPNGRMVIPVGDFYQELKVFSKAADGTVTEKSVLPVRFVPMTGEAEKP
ncbi:MAG: protein-L-isoaspartate(D-aspartate) O-methyltransferase [Thermoanaerobaculia bacterium]